jgi:phospholipase C
MFVGTTSGQCGPSSQTVGPLAGEQGRCGFGPRLPLLVISPFAQHNYVDRNLSDQSSIINFIEYNWNLHAIHGSADQILAAADLREGMPFDLAGMFDFHGPRNARLFLSPDTGEPSATLR